MMLFIAAKLVCLKVNLGFLLLLDSEHCTTVLPLCILGFLYLATFQ